MELESSIYPNTIDFVNINYYWKRKDLTTRMTSYPSLPGNVPLFQAKKFVSPLEPERTILIQTCFLFCSVLYVFHSGTPKPKCNFFCFSGCPCPEAVDDVLLSTGEKDGIKKNLHSKSLNNISRSTILLRFQIPKSIQRDTDPSSGNQPDLGHVPDTLISFSLVVSLLFSPSLGNFM